MLREGRSGLLVDDVAAGGSGALVLEDLDVLQLTHEDAEGGEDCGVIPDGLAGGSLVLGAAGLLRGKRATTNWAWRHLLMPFGAIADTARVVRDGNIITGGGVTAGIDFALTVAAELAGPDIARSIQLQIEYAPAPPFEAGSPATAPEAIVAELRNRNAKLAARRQQIVERAATRMLAS